MLQYQTYLLKQQQQQHQMLLQRQQQQQTNPFNYQQMMEGVMG